MGLDVSDQEHNCLAATSEFFLRYKAGHTVLCVGPGPSSGRSARIGLLRASVPGGGLSIPKGRGSTLSQILVTTTVGAPRVAKLAQSKPMEHSIQCRSLPLRSLSSKRSSVHLQESYTTWTG